MKLACRSFCHLLLVCLGTIEVFAGPLFPCIKATESASGKFLVVAEAEFETAKSGMPRSAKEVVLRVLPREDFVNVKDRIMSPNRFWTDWTQWSVVLNNSSAHPVPACPVVLIADDGEFLILVNLDPSYSAFDIFRRRDRLGKPPGQEPDRGVLIRSVPLKELWPLEKVSEWEHEIRTDESPQWFSRGAFTFSPDSLELIYKTQWGSVARVSLPTGSVSKE